MRKFEESFDAINQSRWPTLVHKAVHGLALAFNSSGSSRDTRPLDHVSMTARLQPSLQRSADTLPGQAAVKCNLGRACRLEAGSSCARKRRSRWSRLRMCSCCRNLGSTQNGGALVMRVWNPRFNASWLRCSEPSHYSCSFAQTSFVVGS